MRHAVSHLASALQLIQLDTVGGQPRAIGFRLGQLAFQFAVIINLALLRINQEYLSRLQASLLLDVSRFEIHHAHLAGYHHRIVFGDEVAGGA